MTKRNWKYDPDTLAVIDTDACLDQLSVICNVEASGPTNGPLIAAAPDLLAALILCHDELEDVDPNTTTNQAINIARAAIAKAERGAE